mmetsp:Transcript_9921/g.21185  ORF Transcript_9921/g.21185 Transcript_9921/m.21185 type:complete len:206 (-) Transcript_9921:234-851(-)
MLRTSARAAPSDRYAKDSSFSINGDDSFRSVKLKEPRAPRSPIFRRSVSSPEGRRSRMLVSQHPRPPLRGHSNRDAATSAPGTPYSHIATLSRPMRNVTYEKVLEHALSVSPSSKGEKSLTQALSHAIDHYPVLSKPRDLEEQLANLEKGLRNTVLVSLKQGPKGPRSQLPTLATASRAAAVATRLRNLSPMKRRGPARRASKAE